MDTMHENEALIHQFYGAFQDRDAATMGAAYSEDATFSDPVFPSLNTPSVRAMWRMLVERGADLEVSYSDVEANDVSGSARWEAIYTFGATETAEGRKVHNRIQAKFEFADGRIVRHVDDFDFWRWSRMALGVKGVALGWTSFLRHKVQAMAGRRLERALEVPDHS